MSARPPRRPGGPAIPRIRRRTGRAGAVAALGIAAVVAGCADPGASARRLEHALLEREREALRRELDAAPDDHASGVVVAVPATLVEELVSLDLPLEADVDRFRLVVREADVDFGGALALVRLGGVVRWADREDVSAEVEVVGALDVTGIEAASGTLRARVDVLGVRTRDVRVGGASPPAERLVDALAARPVEELRALVRDIEIPVRLLRSLELPAVDEEEVTIAAASVPLEVAVHRVRVGDGILLVELDVDVVVVGGGDAGGGSAATADDVVATPTEGGS